MTFNTLTHPCVVIDVLSDVWVEEIIKELEEGFVINVWADMVIGALSRVQVDITIDVVSDIGVEVMTDINVNVLVAVAIKFVMSAP